MENAPPVAATSIDHGARKECKQKTEKTTRAQPQVRSRRDSSLDSGIHQTLSDSDIDDFTEAVNNRLCFADSVRLSPVGCNETDNLVEEVYVAGFNKTAVAEDGTSSMRSFSDDSLAEKTVKKTQPQVYITPKTTNNKDENNDVLSDDDKSVSTSFSSSSSPSCSTSSELETRSPTDQVIDKTNHYPLPKSPPLSVVVAIDLGTTYSGYAFKYIDHPTDLDIHMMRNCEGEPGLNNQKSPSILLLDPQQNFHSFGCTARDYYHDLEPSESPLWYYFDKFKMTLHNNTDICRNSMLQASNSCEVNALTVFSHALRYFKSQAMNELHSHSDKSTLTCDEVQWVITVPAIWSHTAKQFIREAAFKAGLFSPNQPERLLIALEPEAAAIWCRSLKTSQIEETKSRSTNCDNQADDNNGHCYMVVDCGGGTVDITVHRLQEPDGSLQELHKATGGSCGSLGTATKKSFCTCHVAVHVRRYFECVKNARAKLEINPGITEWKVVTVDYPTVVASICSCFVGVDEEFERLLGGIFGFGFMSRLKVERSAAYTELMLSFESRKRTASPHRHSSLNISPPFAMIDHFRKVTGKEVETVIELYGRPEVKWSSQGCIRLHPSLMAELFRPTVERIIQHIETVLSNPRVSGIITHLYLVGGFAESQILQQAIRQNFSQRLKVVVPQGVALSVLKGAVLFGVNPKVVSVRQARHTYGIGVLRKFQDGVHPVEKLVVKDGQEWCADVLDPLVEMNQTLRVGEVVVRRYTPATNHQSVIVLHIYCAQSPKAKFVTDHGVRRIGTLKLDLSPTSALKEPREIIARLTFGGTEVTASAFDTSSQQYVDTDLSFLT